MPIRKPEDGTENHTAQDDVGGGDDDDDEVSFPNPLANRSCNKFPCFFGLPRPWAFERDPPRDTNIGISFWGRWVESWCHRSIDL